MVFHAEPFSIDTTHDRDDWAFFSLSLSLSLFLLSSVCTDEAEGGRSSPKVLTEQYAKA